MELRIKDIPHRPEVEQKVIGVLLRMPQAFAEVGHLLTRECFYNAALSKTYEAMAALDQEGREINLMNVMDKCREKGYLKGGKQAEVDIVELNYLCREAGTLHELEYDVMTLIKARQSRMLLELSRELQTSTTDPTQDIHEVFEKTIVRLDEISRGLSVNDPKNIAECRFDPTIGTSRVGATGFEELDEILSGGVQRGEVMVIGARPGIGKTALALNIMNHMVTRTNAHPVLFFSAEMPTRQIQERLASLRTRIPLGRIRRRMLSEEELSRIYAAMEAIRETPLYVDDTPSIALSELRRKARKYVRTKGVEVVVVDYLQLVHVALPNPKATTNEQISAISEQMKAMAKELNIPVILLAQLNREVERRGVNAQPMLSDLRDSGSIEQDADIIAFLHRNKPIGMSPDVGSEIGTAGRYLSIEKNRSGETGRDIPLKYVGMYTLFEGIENKESGIRNQESGVELVGDSAADRQQMLMF